MALTNEKINTEFHDALKTHWTKHNAQEQKCLAPGIKLLSERFHVVFGGKFHERFIEPSQLPAELRAALVASIGSETPAEWQNGATTYQVMWNPAWQDQWNLRVNPLAYNPKTDLTITTYPRYY